MAKTDTRPPQRTDAVMTLNLKGKCSWFGGPDDDGVAPDEGLAFIAEVSQQPSIFLPEQPAGTTGLARRLDPETYYIACRWDYDEYPAYMLLENKALVRSTRTGKQFEAFPADWGPNENTGRIADLSEGLMDALGITTDDEVEVTFPSAEIPVMAYKSIVISSGHGKYVRGASGILDEVDEARKVVAAVAEKLTARGVTVKTFNDDVSKTQNENLNRIVDYHNDQERELDISVHFNAYEQVDKPMGTECLYVTQGALAGQMSTAMAEVGFINRGAKKRTDLFFLNNTDMPALLLEICFVDSEADAEIYHDEFDALCENIATVIGGANGGEVIPPSPDVPASVHIEVSGDVEVIVTVNGEVIS
jgi:N-acetylmuramoyl-L-alanine amidase